MKQFSQNYSSGENSDLNDKKDNNLENSDISDGKSENITSKKSSKKHSSIIEKESIDKISLICIISILIVLAVVLILFYNKKKMNKDWIYRNKGICSDIMKKFLIAPNYKLVIWGLFF